MQRARDLRFITAGIAVVADGLIGALALFIFFILITGGGVFHISESISISVRHIVNPLAAFFALLALRLACLRKTPFFNIPSLRLSDLIDQAQETLEKLTRRLSDLKPREIRRIVFWTILVSVLVKIAITGVYFGFFSGDDVEVQEMSFAHLFHWDWQAWELRSPLFPMAFIFPIQFLLNLFGVQSAWPLIFSGRLVVIAFSALNLWLVYRIAARLYGNPVIGLLSLFILALSKLHTTFASSELPQTVASTFVLLGFGFLLSTKRETAAMILSGCALGFAAALRFSEVFYIAPAFLFLFLNKRPARAFSLAFISLAVFFMAIGIGDALYWGSPFFSLKNIVDYTLVKKLSSRGYEPFYAYGADIGLWTNFLVFALALYALKLSNKKIYLWAFSPVVLLSFLPHKEPRYLVPAIPFWAIMAGLASWHFLQKGRTTGLPLRISPIVRKILFFLGAVLICVLVLAHKDPRYVAFGLLLLIIMVGFLFFSNKEERPKKKGQQTALLSPAQSALLMIVLAGLAVIIEIDGFRFRRSESGVEMARYLARLSNVRVLALEEPWRAGGRLYFKNNPVFIDISASRLVEPNYFREMILDRGVDAVGLREGHTGESDFRELLRPYGFREVRFSDKKRKENYRLFLRLKSP